MGPANCGKVAELLDRFLLAVDAGDDPYLVVPSIPDIERAERDLLSRRECVLGGRIGSFDDLLWLVAARSGEPVGGLGEFERRMVLEDVVRSAELTELAGPARFGGFVDGVLRLFDELAASDLPDAVSRRLESWSGGRRDELVSLHIAYRARLAELRTTDVGAARARAAALLGDRLDAWDGVPVLAYGFEDLTGVQLAALRALAARCEVTVSIPYETGRPAFDAVRPVVAALTAEPHDVLELAPGGHAASPLLLRLERGLFDDREQVAYPEADPADGSVVLLEACGVRGVCDQVAAEALAEIRAGVPPEQIAVLARDVGHWSIALRSAFAAHGLDIAVDTRTALGATPAGQALLGLLRFAWFEGDRRELFRFLRSPFSGVPRATVDYAEGRLRGRGALAHDDTRGVLDELDYSRLLAAADRLSQPGDPLDQVTDMVRRMSAAAGGLSARVLGPSGDRHVAALRAVLQAVERLADLQARGLATADRATVLAQLGRVSVQAQGETAGRVQALDIRRARTRRFDVVFLLGLEEGGLPGGPSDSPFVTAEDAAALALRRPEPAERDRHLFYVAVTRPWKRLYLSRQAADDEGRVLEPSPFLDDLRHALGVGGDELPRRRRGLGDLTWELADAPTDRERIRALAVELRTREPWALAVAETQGWSRKLDRARTAYRRRHALTNRAVLSALQATERFSVTELEKFAECSSAWFVERHLQPGEIDYVFGPKESGSVAHTTLHRFYDRMPGELGIERLTRDDLPRAVPLMHSCLAEALKSVRVPRSAAGKEAVRKLELDLEGFLRVESSFPSALVPRDYEVRFGTKTSRTELQAGLRLDGYAVSGTIDRIDRDPSLSARGVVWDYKLGKGARSAAQIESERKLQLPLYILVLRDLIGIEPIAGLYRALGGERKVRGMAVKGELDGLMRNDLMPEDEFWAQVDRAVGYANAIVRRIRGGDIRLDPIGKKCPEWCIRQSGGICRVPRP